MKIFFTFLHRTAYIEGVYYKWHMSSARNSHHTSLYDVQRIQSQYTNIYGHFSINKYLQFFVLL